MRWWRSRPRSEFAFAGLLRINVQGLQLEMLGGPSGREFPRSAVGCEPQRAFARLQRTLALSCPCVYVKSRLPFKLQSFIEPKAQISQNFARTKALTDCNPLCVPCRHLVRVRGAGLPLLFNPCYLNCWRISPAQQQHHALNPSPKGGDFIRLLHPMPNKAINDAACRKATHESLFARPQVKDVSGCAWCVNFITINQHEKANVTFNLCLPIWLRNWSRTANSSKSLFCTTLETMILR